MIGGCTGAAGFNGCCASAAALDCLRRRGRRVDRLLLHRSRRVHRLLHRRGRVDCWRRRSGRVDQLLLGRSQVDRLRRRRRWGDRLLRGCAWVDVARLLHHGRCRLVERHVRQRNVRKFGRPHFVVARLHHPLPCDVRIKDRSGGRNGQRARSFFALKERRTSPGLAGRRAGFPGSSISSSGICGVASGSGGIADQAASPSIRDAALSRLWPPIFNCPSKAR